MIVLIRQPICCRIHTKSRIAVIRSLRALVRGRIRTRIDHSPEARPAAVSYVLRGDREGALSCSFSNRSPIREYAYRR
jgi:hypothetical protein